MQYFPYAKLSVKSSVYSLGYEDTANTSRNYFASEAGPHMDFVLSRIPPYVCRYMCVPYSHNPDDFTDST